MSERMLSSRNSNLVYARGERLDKGRMDHYRKTYLETSAFRKALERLSHLANEIARRKQHQRSHARHNSVLERLFRRARNGQPRTGCQQEFVLLSPRRSERHSSRFFRYRWEPRRTRRAGD